MIKKISLLLAFIIALPLIAALFIKNDYAVEQQITIHANKTQVFNYIKLLRNQNNYSKWAMMDPTMTKTYQGLDGRVGFISAWDSTNAEVGKGEQEIIAIISGERIDFELRFIKPFAATEPAFMTTTTLATGSTQVTWGFKGHMAYPMNILFLFTDFEQMIGSDLQTGLDKLKVILEQ